MSPEDFQPLEDWLVCRPLSPKEERHGLVLTHLDLENKTVSEGVAEVISTGPGKWSTSLKAHLDHGIRPGDKILYRGFLRFVHQVGEEFGLRRIDVFVLRAEDVLGILEGRGTVGLFDEYEV